MNEHVITARRTPEIIAGEIRTFTASMLNNIIEIGRRMCEAKELLPYGEFGKWITEATGYSSSTANNFMRLYQEYGADQGSLFGAEVDCQTFGKLSYSKALALLAVPKEERETVAAELDAEHLSTRELEKALRERDEARKAAAAANEERGFWESKATEKAQEVDKVTAERDRILREAQDDKERIRELEARPVEVAVERDEAAITKAAEEARKAAEDAAKAELDKLKARLEKAEKAREKAEAAEKRAAEDAGPAREEAAKAKAEAETLRKKLVAAESGASAAAALFSVAQQNFNSAFEKVQAMKATHPDVAGKLLVGMETVLSGLVEKVKEARG